MGFDLKWILEATLGELKSSEAADFISFGTDTRKDLSGQMFVALKGENYDAHDFVEAAIAAGAAGILVHKSVDVKNHKITVVQVPDTLKALQSLAKSYRKKLGNQVVAITGSNGKTTTKEFLSQMISPYRRTHYNEGSFNNHWGVPLTILSQPQDTQVLISEVGMNHHGEITELVKVIDPDIVVCTMVGRAHIEHFGTVEKIAEAKEEIYRASRPDVQRIFNLDNPYTKRMFEQSPLNYPATRRFWSFSNRTKECDVFLNIQDYSWKGLRVSGSLMGVSGQADIPLLGEHNIVNVMAAASCALALGLTPEEVWARIPQLQSSWGRNQVVLTETGATIVFDAYNANPDSMSALLINTQALQSPAKKYAVLGQMRELGVHATKEHEALGRLVAQQKWERVLFFGANHEDFRRGYESSENQNNLLTSNTYEDSLAMQVSSVLGKDDVVVVKASRGEKLERFVELCHPKNFTAKK